jgi:hypothetical protein
MIVGGTPEVLRLLEVDDVCITGAILLPKSPQFQFPTHVLYLEV